MWWGWFLAKARLAPGFGCVARCADPLPPGLCVSKQVTVPVMLYLPGAAQQSTSGTIRKRRSCPIRAAQQSTRGGLVPSSSITSACLQLRLSSNSFARLHVRLNVGPEYVWVSKRIQGYLPTLGLVTPPICFCARATPPRPAPRRAPGPGNRTTASAPGGCRSVIQ